MIGGYTYGFMPCRRTLTLIEMQTASSGFELRLPIPFPMTRSMSPHDSFFFLVEPYIIKPSISGKLKGFFFNSYYKCREGRNTFPWTAPLYP